MNICRTLYPNCWSRLKIQRDKYDELKAPDVDLRMWVNFPNRETQHGEWWFRLVDYITYMVSTFHSVIHDDLIRNICDKGPSITDTLIVWRSLARLAFHGTLPYNFPNQCANSGLLYCLEYTHENGNQWDRSTCESAVSGGHLKCLMYAHENGCSWDEQTFYEAVENGHLDCRTYAHENGCSWDEVTCFMSAKNWMSEVCAWKWCPYDHRTFKTAVLYCLNYFEIGIIYRRLHYNSKCWYLGFCSQIFKYALW